MNGTIIEIGYGENFGFWRYALQGIGGPRDVVKWLFALEVAHPPFARPMPHRAEANEETLIATVPAGYAQGARLPWWAKILVKMVLARLPVRYSVWRRLGIFRHGGTGDNAQQVVDGFLAHLERYRRMSGDRSLTSIVELGPGDSVGRALCAAACGASEIHLVDVSDTAPEAPDHYHAVGAHLQERDLTVPTLPSSAGKTAVFEATGAVLHTDGLKALAAMAPESVDLILSDAVLEHLRLEQFETFMAESFRILRPGGIASHGVDLHDHLGGALNHLRFPQWLWEHQLMAGSGFYTNRLGFSEMQRIAENAGFTVQVPWIRRWPTLPTPRRALARPFRERSEDELTVCSFGLVLRKPDRPSPSAPLSAGGNSSGQ